MVALGGATQDPSAFSAVTTSTIFINNIYNFMVQYKFDGLDIDWEFPQSSDKDNLVTMLKNFRTKFGTNYILSAAVSADAAYIGTSYDVPGMNLYLDFFNVMTYDFHGSWESFVACNSPVYGSTTSDPWSVNGVIPNYIIAGANSSKVIVGVPFYANIYTLSSSTNFKIGSSAFPSNQLPYSQVCNTVKTYTTVIDPTQQCAYAYSGTNWISYENVQSVTLKCQYAVNRNLGGAMVWAIDQDDIKNVCGGGSYPLINTINSVIRGGTPVTTTTSGPTTTTKPTTTTTKSTTTTRATTTTKSSSTTTQKTSTPTAGTSTTSSGGLICTSSGFLRDPTNCAAFYQCVPDQPINPVWRFTCGSGLLFDYSCSCCNWADAVVC